MPRSGGTAAGQRPTLMRVSKCECNLGGRKQSGGGPGHGSIQRHQAPAAVGGAAHPIPTHRDRQQQPVNGGPPVGAAGAGWRRWEGSECKQLQHALCSVLRHVPDQGLLQGARQREEGRRTREGSRMVRHLAAVHQVRPGCAAALPARLSGARSGGPAQPALPLTRIANRDAMVSSISRRKPGQASQRCAMRGACTLSGGQQGWRGPRHGCALGFTPPPSEGMPPACHSSHCMGAQPDRPPPGRPHPPAGALPAAARTAARAVAAHWLVAAAARRLPPCTGVAAGRQGKPAGSARCWAGRRRQRGEGQGAADWAPHPAVPSRTSDEWDGAHAGALAAGGTDLMAGLRWGSLGPYQCVKIVHCCMSCCTNCSCS